MVGNKIDWPQTHACHSKLTNLHVFLHKINNFCTCIYIFSDSIIGYRNTDLVVEQIEGTIMCGHVHIIQMGCIWLVTHETDLSTISVHPPTVLLHGLLNNHSKLSVKHS